ncbi:MAG: histidine kinase [Lachnospiraceae bacterium]|nr:histidine kinase [Lachnospiraceae bacterium]
MKISGNRVGSVFRSLTVQFFFLFMVILMLQSVIIFYSVNRKVSEELIVTIDNYMTTYSETLGNNLDTYIEEINRNSRIILSNELVQNAVRRRYEPGYSVVQEIEDNGTIQYIIFSFTALRDDTQMILADREGDIFLRAQSSYYGGGGNIFENSYLSEQREKLDAGEYVAVPACNSDFEDYSGNPVYMLVRSLKDINNGNIIAYMVTLFPSKYIDAMLYDAAQGIRNIEIHILDQTQEIIAGTDQSMIGVVLNQNNADKFKEISCISAATGWKVLLRMPTEYLNKNFVSSWEEILPVIKVTTLLSGLLWCLITYSSIVMPIKKVNWSMKKVQSGDWTVQIMDRAPSIDISRLYHGFDEMVNEIGRLTRKNLQEQIMFKDAQMEALRYQINPHFLFNTLQTIESIAEVYEVPEIQVISKSMGNMFHYNIRGFEVVTLDEELEMIDSFMQIEKIRFGDQFVYEIEAGEKDRKRRILKFILQPIVENSIKYGLSGNENKWIRIDSFSEHSVLTIDVVNSGNPMEQERVRKINLMLEEAKNSADVGWLSDSIGMMNVHRRLITRFGPAFGVCILYSDERGTCVRLTMPDEYGEGGL